MSDEMGVTLLDRGASSQIKSDLRRTQLERRRLWIKDLPPSQLHEAESKIASGVLELLPQAGPTALYAARADETSVTEVAKLNPERRWAFPRVSGDQLQFLIPNSLDEMVEGRFGIREPDPARSAPVGVDELSAIVVPGVAFDRSGARLGYGKGFYDRALSGYRGLKIGVCFSVQVTADFIPQDSHDVTMDYVVTEKYSFQPISYEKGTS